MRLLLIYAILLPLVAPAAEEATPEAIAKRQIEAMRSCDWAQVAYYTHPKALAQIKELFLPIATAAADAEGNPAAEQMMRSLFGGKTATQLAAETAPGFFKIVMTGMATVVPDFKQSMSGMQAEILGHVAEGDTAAHVVYRLSRPTADGSTTKIAVTSLERDGKTWKALLNSDLETVARAITSRLQPR